MKNQVDRLLIEELLRLVASAWNVTEAELQIKQKKKFYIPRTAFSYLACEIFGQPSKALVAISVIKRPSSFCYQARREVKSSPEVMKKILGIKWQIENNVIRFDPRGNMRIPHNLVLIEVLTSAIFASFGASKTELKITGKKLEYVIPRRVFCHIACEVFGQPSNVLHNIGLFKTYAWREFRIQTRRWWKGADRKLRSNVNEIRDRILKSGISLDPKPKVNSRLVRLAIEEVALAFDTSLFNVKAKYSKCQFLREPRLVFGYLICHLLLQPREAVSCLGVKSLRQMDLLYQAKWFVESNPALLNFLFLLRDRIKARLNLESLPPAIKWSTVGMTIADYVSTLKK